MPYLYRMIFFFTGEICIKYLQTVRVQSCITKCTPFIILILKASKNRVLNIQVEIVYDNERHCIFSPIQVYLAMRRCTHSRQSCSNFHSIMLLDKNPTQFQNKLQLSNLAAQFQLSVSLCSNMLKNMSTCIFPSRWSGQNYYSFRIFSDGFIVKIGFS